MLVFNLRILCGVRSNTTKMADKDVYYINLSSNPIRFDPVSKVTHLFFDENNKQVFTVRSGGVMGVQVQGPSPEFCHSFRMADKGPIVSMKLSPVQTVLALQRSKTSVEFANLRGGFLDESEYSQGSRNKSAIILGFVWSQSDEILLITDQGVELFQVLKEKRTLKALKYINTTVSWLVSCPATQLLVLAGGRTSSTLQPILYSQPGQLQKASKFQVEVPITSSKGVLVERDVTVTRLYGQTCILVLRHPPRPPGASQPPGQILVYTMHKTLLTTRRTHTLLLESSGRSALSVVDNLILVHHQASRNTLLFDTGGEPDSSEPLTVKPLLPARSIRPVSVQMPGQDAVHCQLYSPNWGVFQPNVIIDAKLGFLWNVELDLPLLVNSFPPAITTISMLLRRHQDLALPLLLQVLEELTNPCKKPPCDLSMIGEVFDIINVPYRRQMDLLAQTQVAAPATLVGNSGGGTNVTKDPSPDMIVLDQSLMYSHIFSKFPEKKLLDSYDGEFGVKVILEYIRSLTDVRIPIYDLNELLITCLMNEERGLSRLHLLLQYRILGDSKPLACSLVSLEHLYPPALQLSLDMLKRLGTADDEIIEILLHKSQVLTTIRYAIAAGMENHISARKFLEAAQSTGDRNLFVSVFKFFEQRNKKMRGSTGFVEGELCDPFVDYFRKLIVEEHYSSV